MELRSAAAGRILSMQITIVGVMMTEWLKNIDLPLSDQVWTG